MDGVPLVTVQETCPLAEPQDASVLLVVTSMSGSTGTEYEPVAVHPFESVTVTVTLDPPHKPVTALPVEELDQE